MSPWGANTDNLLPMEGKGTFPLGVGTTFRCFDMRGFAFHGTCCVTCVMSRQLLGDWIYGGCGVELLLDQIDQNDRRMGVPS
jgi:hypothetical protein